MIDVIRDAWPWLIPAFLIGVLCGWLVTRPYERNRAAAFAAVPRLNPEELARGTAILGFKVRLNDLRAVEGIGPKIERLMNNDGIRTWADLAEAKVARLETILDAAGPKYQMHVPKTWPQQATLLSEARWAEFKKLTDRLKGGR
jgi:predicted flap endonuclease-1-like 5' DNA nuclease